jgi:hypothetical protein
VCVCVVCVCVVCVCVCECVYISVTLHKTVFCILTPLYITALFLISVSKVYTVSGFFQMAPTGRVYTRISFTIVVPPRVINCRNINSIICCMWQAWCHIFISFSVTLLLYCLHFSYFCTLCFHRDKMLDPWSVCVCVCVLHVCMHVCNITLPTDLWPKLD